MKKIQYALFICLAYMAISIFPLQAANQSEQRLEDDRNPSELRPLNVKPSTISLPPLPEAEKDLAKKRKKQQKRVKQNDADAFLANSIAGADRFVGIFKPKKPLIRQSNNKQITQKKPFPQKTSEETRHAVEMAMALLDTNSASPASAQPTPGHGSATSNKKSECEAAVKWLASLHPIIITEIKSDTRQRYPGNVEKQLYGVKYLYENDRVLYDAISNELKRQEKNKKEAEAAFSKFLAATTALKENPELSQNEKNFANATLALHSTDIATLDQTSQDILKRMGITPEILQATKNFPSVSKRTLTEKGKAYLARLKSQDFQSNLPLSESDLTERLDDKDHNRGLISMSLNVPQLNNTNCHSCNEKLTSFKTCSKCQNAYYCSRACQVKDWKDKHKKQCCKQEIPKSAAQEIEKTKSEKYEQRRLLRLTHASPTERALLLFLPEELQADFQIPDLSAPDVQESLAAYKRKNPNLTHKQAQNLWINEYKAKETERINRLQNYTIQPSPELKEQIIKIEKGKLPVLTQKISTPLAMAVPLEKSDREKDLLELQQSLNNPSNELPDRSTPRLIAPPQPKTLQENPFAETKKRQQQDAEEKENKSAQLVIAMQQLEVEPKNSPRHAIYFEKFRTLFYGNYKLVGTAVEEHTSLLNSLIRKYKLGHNAWKPERVKQSSAADRTLPKPRKNKSGHGNGNPPVGRSKGAPKPTIQKQVLKAMIEKTTAKKPKPERLPSEPPMTPAQRKLWSRDVEQLAPPAPAPSPLIPEPKAPGEDETKEFAALNAQESAPIATKSYSIPYGDGSILRKGHAEKHHCPNDPRYEKLDPEYKHPNGCYKIDDTTLYPCHLSKAQLLENIGYAIRHGTPYIDSDLRTKILGQFPPNDTGHPIYILAVTEQNPETGQNEILTDFSISKRTHIRKSLESQNVHEQHERGLLAKRWQQEKKRKKELRLITLQQQKELRLETRRQEKLHRAALQLQHEPQAPVPAQEETFQPWVRGVGPQGNLPPLDFQR